MENNKTLRDEFALTICGGLIHLADKEELQSIMTPAGQIYFPQMVYILADAMMAEREKKGV